MTRSFTSYADALNAVSMIEMYALSNGLPFPQFTIAYFEGAYVVTKD